MGNWWKDPRLDDEGTYDYLVEELPKDYEKWELSKYKWRCDECGKESHVLFHSVHHFYCWDGYDYMDYNECWRCMISNKLHRIKHKIKKQIKILKTAIELCKLEPKGSFKKNYKFAKQLEG